MMAAKYEYHDKYWSAHSSTYDLNVGYMTRTAADHLIKLTETLLPYIGPNCYVLDSGAGTGSLTISLSERFPSVPILATDISSGMLSIIDALKLPNVSTQLLDASQAGQLETQHFSHALSTLLIQFLPDPQAVVKDMYRAIQPGGVLGFGIWHYHNDPNQAWAKACHILDPTYKAPKPHVATAWYSTQELEKALRDVGLQDVRSEVVTVQHVHPSTESFLTFWFEGRNPAIQSMINDWTGSLEDVKRELAKIIREEFDDGKALFLSFAIAAGKKSL